MYQSPDFVKVNLEVKDNFAAYTSCYRDSWTVLTKNELVVPSGACQVETVVEYGSSETDYQCFNSDMGY